MVLLAAWYLSGDNSLVPLLGTMGRRALTSGDVESGLDRITVAYRLALTDRVPPLFTLHLFPKHAEKPCPALAARAFAHCGHCRRRYAHRDDDALVMMH
jgi:hypothetical protein